MPPRFSGMKTPLLYSTLTAVALSLGSMQAAEEKTIGEKTGQVIDKTVEKSKELGRKTVEKTKEAGRAVAEGTKKATAAAKDAVTSDSDARKVDVTLSEHKIDMPMQLASGKTAFVVRNAGKYEHSFEIAGEGLDKKFLLAVDPNETKTLDVDLKPGTYKVRCPVKGHEAKGMEASLTVK
jgi:uncharacterized cupredoxin-like copper-binding protein